MPSVVLLPEHGAEGFLWDLRAVLAHPCNCTSNLSYMAWGHGSFTGIGDDWLTRPSLPLDVCLKKEGFLPMVSRQENWPKWPLWKQFRPLPATPAGPTPSQHSVVCVGLFQLGDHLKRKSKEGSLWKCHVDCHQWGRSGAASGSEGRAGTATEHMGCIRISGPLPGKGWQGNWLMPGEVIDLLWWAWGGSG